MMAAAGKNGLPSYHLIKKNKKRSKKMKKEYENPKVSLTFFESDDVITSSGAGEGNNSNENGFFLGGTHIEGGFWS